MILGELHRLNDLELNYSACGCQLRKSCGLPCACELLAYLNSGEAIPLDSVDIFWRTLDVSWSTPLEYEDIQCDDELHIFKETFNKQSNAGNKSLLRRLGDIINPSTNLIREPVVKKFSWTSKLEETKKEEVCLSEKSGSRPPQSEPYETIVIANVYGNHFIKAELREGFPLPMTHPLWRTYRSDIASRWEDPYVSRQEEFREHYYSIPEFFDLSK
uniref:Protein FAR1-RELATED SEQUENCE n=1 Tax=Tanacetum cinerariifolium TaxID=118510 RepID=A0A699IFT5_TANCI|nr:hypothetical protein [Tanacetum cinerariifolium]